MAEYCIIEWMAVWIAIGENGCAAGTDVCKGITGIWGAKSIYIAVKRAIYSELSRPSIDTTAGRDSAGVSHSINTLGVWW